LKQINPSFTDAYYDYTAAVYAAICYNNKLLLLY
jgi:hypothetical protein